MQTRNGLAERGRDGSGILMGILVVAFVLLLGFLILIWPETRPMDAKSVDGRLATLEPDVRVETASILSRPPVMDGIHRRAGDPITPNDVQDAIGLARQRIDWRRESARDNERLTELRRALVETPLNHPHGAAAPPQNIEHGNKP